MSGIISDNVLRQSGLIKAPAGGAWTFISKSTASTSANVSFTSGIDSTYGTYVFTLNNIHPGSDEMDILVNFSIDGGSNYNVTKTGSNFNAYHNEGDSATALTYHPGHDIVQSTAGNVIAYDTGNDNDQASSGYLYLFNPSSTTFVKHFQSCMSATHTSDYQNNYFSAGYGNTTSAINAVQFSMSSGNIDAGDICLYGITA